MAFGLPAHGELNWDDEVNSSILATKDAADSALTAANAAVATAGDLANRVTSLESRAADSTFLTYATLAAAQTGLVNGEFADGAVIVIGP